MGVVGAVDLHWTTRRTGVGCGEWYQYDMQCHLITHFLHSHNYQLTCIIQHDSSDSPSSPVVIWLIHFSNLISVLDMAPKGCTQLALEWLCCLHVTFFEQCILSLH